jgi:hypothetical protein
MKRLMSTIKKNRSSKSDDVELPKHELKVPAQVRRPMARARLLR